ncbi:hypothetical protein BJ165DRAFT_1527020 [Panaeolus papilionaceus]|nr:hypothetical protein BJ165DRAFT_1527020 [Panaeolus papilionaceus]
MPLHPTIIYEDYEVQESEAKQMEENIPPDLAVFTSRCFHTCTTVGCPAFIDAYKPLRTVVDAILSDTAVGSAKRGIGTKAGTATTQRLDHSIVSEFGGRDIRLKPNEDSVARGKIRVKTDAGLMAALLYTVMDMSDDGRLSGDEFAAICVWAAE